MVLAARLCPVGLTVSCWRHTYGWLVAPPKAKKVALRTWPHPIAW